MLSFGFLPRRRCFSAQPFRKISTILSNLARFAPVILRNFVFEYSAIFSYFMPLFLHSPLFSQELYSILDRADSIVCASRTYYKNCMLDRNHFLVDLAAALLAVYRR